MRNRSGLVIGWLSIAGFVACGGKAHSLGGEEVKQQQEGNAGTGGGNGNSNAGGATVGTGATASAAAVADGGTSQPPSPGAGNGGAAPTYTTGSCGLCENVVVTEGIASLGCCLDDGTCGVDSSSASFYARDTSGRRGIPGSCQPRDQAGVPDSHCTSQSAGGYVLNGCCRPEGTCGVDVGILHLGCVQAVVLPESPPPADGGGPLPGPVSPETCNYAPVLPDDAGL